MDLHSVQRALSTVPPLRLLAAVLVAGSAAGLLRPATAAVAGVSIAALLVAAATRAPSRRIRLALGLIGFGLVAGALRGASAPPPPAPEGFRETPVVLEGVAIDAPLVRRDAAGGREAALLMRLRGEARQAAVRVRLAPGEPPPSLDPGDAVRLSGRCTAPRAPSNPGERDARDALRRDGVVLRVTAPTTGALVIEPPGERSPLDTLRRAGGRLRRIVRARLDGAVGSRPRARAVLAALLVGDRAALSDDVAERFRRSGAAHLLAVSGLHVVLLVGVVTALLETLRARLVPGRRGRTGVLVLSLMFVLAYAAVCRLATPVVRAAVFVAVALVARHAGRRTGTADHLAAAAALVAAADPAQALQPGFHLSFSAVAGLCALTPRFREALFAPWDLLARFPEALPPWRLRMHAWLARGVSASLAAWVATAPVTAAVFGELHPVGPLSNLIAVPFVGLLLPAAALGAVLGPVAEPVAGPLLATAVDALTGMLTLLSRLPGATITTGDVPPWGCALAALLLVVAALRRPWRPRHLSAPVLALALLAVSSAAGAHPPGAGRPSVTALDVGHGVAVLLRGGSGGAVLYDAGGRLPGTAERIVVPALAALGVDRLAAVAISHEDADHSAAVPDLVSRVPVGAVLVPAGFGGSPAGRRVLRACRARSIPVVRLGRGDTWSIGDVRLAVLHPAPDAIGPAENEGSLVLAARLGIRGGERLDLLLPGDVEGTTLDMLAADPTLPRADVLLLPHHGRGPPEPQIRLARRCGAEHLVASTPATYPTSVPGAWVTGRDGALLITPGSPPRSLAPAAD